MNAPLPQAIHRQIGSMSQSEAAEALDRIDADFDAAVTARASLIERAALPSDITEVLGALVLPEDVTVICAAFRSGAADLALGPVLVRILRREWHDQAEIECIRLAETCLSPGDSMRVTAKDLQRAAVIAQMGGKHG
ncbi:hypothetical protein PIN31115_02058 [Pandoraea iniqua]|uniref:Uncharacterized protein n=1 Tax=Pandoraea iniqua TaxID=2508288 RepID=A0A5E4UP09_9BURK|nr:hypothetical protein [Pandoraea iniqua]VVE00100.1 hypothetical protein PIN31115_02058 [Pandoraea iniqua]